MITKHKDARVVVIGAGFAGLKAVNRLARAGVQVSLIDKNNYHLFQPLLYQVATTGLNPSEISSTVRRNFNRFKNVNIIKAELTDLDKDDKVAVCDEGELKIPYDYLILCAGSKVGYFGNDDWCKIAPGLKSLKDATTIRNRYLNNFELAELASKPSEVNRLTTVVIIGGGPTGVELAGAFAELRSQVLKRDFREFNPTAARVILIEGGASLLHGYASELSNYTLKRLQRLGVEIYLDERVLGIDESGVRTAQHEFVSANVIWAAGVEGLPIASKLAKEVTGRNAIVVNPDLSLPEDSSIYACGDIAYFGHDKRYPKGLPGVAQVAMQQGELAAKNILASLSGKKTEAFHYFDKGKMATIGRSAAVAEAGSLKMKGLLAWLSWLFIHVLYLIEFQEKIVVFLRWIWSYLTWNWGVRIIFPSPAKPKVSLRDKP